MYCTTAGTLRSRGNTIALEQDLSGFVSTLPVEPSSTGWIQVVRQGDDTKSQHPDLRLEAKLVRRIIDYHISLRTPGYENVKFNEQVLSSLPTNGFDMKLGMEVSPEEYDRLNGVPQGPPTETEDLDCETDGVKESTPTSVDAKTGGVESDTTNTNCDRGPRFVPKPVKKPTVEMAVRAMARGDDPMLAYPKIEGTPFSEYNTPYLLTKLFPHLFPGGVGDPTAPGRNIDVPLQKSVEHLLHLRYADEDGNFTYPFAEDASFVFYVGNLIHRQSVIQKAGIYFKRNPESDKLTKRDLIKLSDDSFQKLMSKIGYFTGQVLMSRGYWQNKGKILKDLADTEGVFDIFYTFSYSERHDPYLHRLYKGPVGRQKNLVPHLIDGLYCRRMDSFRKHWLFGTMGASSSWDRDEWQGRDMIHTHGMASLVRKLGLRKYHDLAAKHEQSRRLAEERGDADAASQVLGNINENTHQCTNKHTYTYA